MPCSIKEPGLYDYVIFNDELEDAFAQLMLVAKRALSGKQGNGSQSITGPVTLVAEEEPSKASQPAAQTVASATPAQVSGSCMMSLKRCFRRVYRQMVCRSAYLISDTCHPRC